jgi:hypothetical protein
MVITPDVIAAARGTPVWGGKLKLSGVVSATVVLVKVSETPPTVRTVLVAVPPVAAEVWRTQTVSPGDAVPAAEVNELVQPRE